MIELKKLRLLLFSEVPNQKLVAKKRRNTWEIMEYQVIGI